MTAPEKGETVRLTVQKVRKHLLNLLFHMAVKEGTKNYVTWIRQLGWSNCLFWKRRLLFQSLMLSELKRLFIQVLPGGCGLVFLTDAQNWYAALPRP